jgi:hypothetical protein
LQINSFLNLKVLLHINWMIGNRLVALLPLMKHEQQQYRGLAFAHAQGSYSLVHGAGQKLRVE